MSSSATACGIRGGQAVAALLVLALICAQPAAVAGAAAPPVRVGLVGDSIVEDGGVTPPARPAGALRSELRRQG